MKNPNFPANVIKLLELNTETLPTDFVPTLYYLAYQRSQRYADMFFAYYKTDITLEGIARHNDISHERVRQCITKIERTLCKYKRIIQMGLQNYHDYCIEMKRERLRESLIARMAKEYDPPKDYQNIKADIPNATSIVEMGLSTRTYNVLNRNGFYTIQDVIDAGPKHIFNLRNCGILSYIELAKTLITEFNQPRSIWAIDPRDGTKLTI